MPLKYITSRFGFFLWISASILALITGCIKSDHRGGGCPRGINISFYSKNPCQSDSVFPQINNITICVFDKNDVLAEYIRKEGISLTSSYSEQLEVESGLYTVIAWGGIDDDLYDIYELENGVTEKNDLLFRLKRNEAYAYSIEGNRIYYGVSPALYVSESSKNRYENTSVNLQEITNRFNIFIDGLGVPEEYEIIIKSNNGSYNLNSSIAADDIIEYEPLVSIEEKTLRNDFTILKLETGIENTIIIRHKGNGLELFRGNLLGTLLLKNPQVNLNCDHDFTIRFSARDNCQCGTYMVTEIWVNDWLVHSYNTDV